MSKRIIIIGGPRTGKSTEARRLRNEEGIPTFCTDPASLAPFTENEVTYLPEGLGWSESSQFVADYWMTQDGPWCIEGVAAVRASRKVLQGDEDAVAAWLEGLSVTLRLVPIPNVELLQGQVSMLKAVSTIWNGIAERFDDVEVDGE